MFMVEGRNKKAITLNLKTAKGQQIKEKINPELKGYSQLSRR